MFCANVVGLQKYDFAASIRLCLKTRSGFERLIFRLAVPMYIGSSIDGKAKIACFAVFARRKNARSRAGDGVFRKNIVSCHGKIGN